MKKPEIVWDIGVGNSLARYALHIFPSEVVPIPDEAGVVRDMTVYNGTIILACENGPYILEDGAFVRLPAT